ncbi:DUF6913 domain-containing protein [Alkalitalea saponilacus]|uniref:Uncharacterized protein n=1 Tax=Alkalitalea saponilacus TaxID=889453 RepID=A0A1T5DF19_9BACT|nr:hypothetical protein [Alkalitalea saponilacus]ASB50685.1 hypothetical protein CDL62_16770 [Alkalitalea saponilacus]SKB70348.1 hypothetical protein SAMN03080601_01093 [Alkalitalea saponilacus]
MKLFRKTRTRVGAWILNRQAKSVKRIVNVISLKQAKNIAIVFDAGDKGIVDEVNRFIKSRTEFGTNFTLLGYIPEHVTEHNYISDKKKTFFTVKDLGFFMYPQSESVSAFIESTPDLLVVISRYYYFPLHWVVKLSKARFKAGASKPFGDDLDFMIELNEQNDIYLTDQLAHYLGSINENKMA